MMSLLAAGGSAAVIAGLEAYGASTPERVRLVSVAQAAVSGGLAAMMGARYRASGKVMPAGAVAALSLILCIAYATRAASAAATKRA